MNRGFTIVELLVSMAIFVIMTSVIVAKFGNFNQSTLLTDTAYDIALVVRLAQTYGLSVKSTTQSGTANFNFPYGVDFNAGTSAACGSGASSNPSSLVLFADIPDSGGATDGMCSSSDATINPYIIIRGATVSALCAGADASACSSVSRLDVSFRRPNPSAVICASNGGAAQCNYAYAQATIRGTDNSTRVIVMRQNGQISVQR